MTLALLITTGFWKIEKNRERPLSSAPHAGAAAPAQARSPMEGKQAPDFTLPSLAGGEITLSDYRGKLVFLNIWATWCAPCREEMPSMQKLYKKFADRKFVMLTVSIDENRADIPPFVEELGLTFPIALDTQSRVAQLYGLTGVPETFLISPAGKVLHHIVGPSDWFEPGIVGAFDSMLRKLD